MSGFSTQWLALREPADQRARNSALADDLRTRLGDVSPLRVVDIGAGTGANLRATAPLLGPQQSWRLLDHDPALLAQAALALADWADFSAHDSGRLTLEKDGLHIAVELVQVDLAAHPEAVRAGDPHLITASAFFDLVSAPWIERFADAVVAAGATFFTVLTCDGRDLWTPPHEADAAVAAAFRADQGRDKGFGAGAGDVATDLLLHALHQRGYEAHARESPWLLEAAEPGDAALIAALATGTAAAAEETGQVLHSRLEAWRAARIAATHCRIGHMDLLAAPKRG